MKFTKKNDKLNSEKVKESDDDRPKKIKRNLGERSKSATPLTKAIPLKNNKKVYLILPIGL